ncbi:hypothetical protein BC827DRAFT_877723 [Russula dissimulans]|nr:hypothetical protein BC827DRAFT_877723 [Russula dissimulans]
MSSSPSSSTENLPNLPQSGSSPDIPADPPTPQQYVGHIFHFRLPPLSILKTPALPPQRPSLQALYWQTRYWQAPWSQARRCLVL